LRFLPCQAYAKGAAPDDRANMAERVLENHAEVAKPPSGADLTSKEVAEICQWC
jgi:hypothetical protein